MKIVLTRDDIKDILLTRIFEVYNRDLDVQDKSQITFNEWMLPYEDLTFEKKRVIEVKLEDVLDVVAEQLKTARQEG